MHTCSPSATRTPPSRPSVIAAASVIPPVLPMKVSLVRSTACFAAFVEANPVARRVSRWRSQRGHGPGGFPVQAEGVHRQHSR